MTRALGDLWRRINKDRSESWRASFRKSVTEWWWSYYAESVERTAACRPHLWEYHEHRRKTFALYMYLDMCEIVDGVDLPEQVRRLLAMLNLRNVISEHGYFINDITSIAKEASLGYYHNAVAIIEHQPDVSRRQAITEITALADERAQRAEQLLAALPVQLDAAGITGKQRDDTLKVADSYRGQMRGNFDYHIHALRHGVHRYAFAQSSDAAAARITSLFA